MKTLKTLNPLTKLVPAVLTLALLTAVCGVGHVLGSVALGLIGIALGLAVGRLEIIEGLRGDLAAWLLIGFGLAYLAWGVRQAYRNRPHTHWHQHDGVTHHHAHTHQEDHAHVHEQAGGASLTPWIVFTVVRRYPQTATLW